MGKLIILILLISTCVYAQISGSFIEKAEKGDPKASYEVGKHYYEAANIYGGYEKAYKWLMKSASLGNEKAQNAIGVMHYKGIGTNKDYNLAFKWFSKAAEKQDADAQLNLARLYYYGKGTDRDTKQAEFWLLKAADNGNIEAAVTAADLYISNQIGDKDYHKGFDIMLSAAETNSYAAYRVGEFYARGIGVDKDTRLAEIWFDKASNDISIIPLIALKYRTGKDVNIDYKKAMNLYLTAAKEGNALAQLNIGNMYENGEGIGVNREKALEWYKLAHKNGSASAKYYIESLETGEHVLDIMDRYGYIDNITAD